MSQRSHIAKRGRSEISACSAAWSAETSVGIVSMPTRAGGRRARTTRPPSRTTSRGGRAASCRSRSRRRSPSAGTRPPARGRRSARRGARTPATSAVRSGSTMDVSVSFRACVYQSTVTVRTSAVRDSRSRDGDAVLVAEMEVHGSLVDRSRRRARARTCRAPRRSPRRRSRTPRCRRSGARNARRGRVAAAPDEPRSRRLELGQHGRPFERLRPEDRRVGLRQRAFVRGREHVAVEDPRRRVVDQRGLGPSARAAPPARS